MMIMMIYMTSCVFFFVILGGGVRKEGKKEEGDLGIPLCLFSACLSLSAGQDICTIGRVLVNAVK